MTTSTRSKAKAKPPYVVMGLDVSTRTGVAVACGARLETLVWHWGPSAHQPGRFHRWRLYSSALEAALRIHLPDFIVFENYFFSNKHTLVTLVEVGTVLRAAATAAAVPWVEVSPGALKKFTTGSGAAKKSAMLLHAYRTFGLDVDGDEDRCDAAALALFGQALLRELPHRLPARQLEAVTTFERNNAEQIGAVCGGSRGAVDSAAPRRKSLRRTKHV